jgi:hypothetical protein
VYRHICRRIDSFFRLIKHIGTFIHSYIRHQKISNVVCIYRAELEVIRKAASAEDQLYNYAADPFVVSEAKMKAAQEKEKLGRQESERE